MDIRIKEVMCNLKNYDFDVLGAYRMDKREAQKLLDVLEKSHFSGSERWIPIEYDGYADGSETILEVCEEICNNYCKYSNNKCGGHINSDGTCGHYEDCPLNRLN